MFPLADKVPKSVYSNGANLARVCLKNTIKCRVQIALQYGYVPLIIYLGMKVGFEVGNIFNDVYKFQMPNGESVPMHLTDVLLLGGQQISFVIKFQSE